MTPGEAQDNSVTFEYIQIGEVQYSVPKKLFDYFNGIIAERADLKEQVGNLNAQIAALREGVGILAEANRKLEKENDNLNTGIIQGHHGC